MMLSTGTFADTFQHAIQRRSQGGSTYPLADIAVNTAVSSYKMWWVCCPVWSQRSSYMCLLVETILVCNGNSKLHSIANITHTVISSSVQEVKLSRSLGLTGVSCLLPNDYS